MGASQRKQMSSKIEAAEGVAESLAVADAKTLAYDPDLIFEPERTERTPSTASFSKRSRVTGKVPGTFTFGQELRGSGVNGTAPDWIRHLKACGFVESQLKQITIGAITSGPFKHGETITGGTSGGKGRVVIDTSTGTTVLYYVVISGALQNAETITGGTSGATATTGSVPSTAALEYRYTSDITLVPSLTMSLNRDVSTALSATGLASKMAGSRGNVTFDFKAGKPAMMNFDFKGVKSSVTDAVFLSPSPETTIAPVLLNAQLKWGTNSPKFSELSLDMGNETAFDEDANAALGITAALIVGRNPTGTLLIKAVPAATYDFHSDHFSDAEKTLDFWVGSAAGNKFRFYLPKVQIGDIKTVTREGINAFQMTIELGQNTETGDDEITILAF